MNKSKKDKKKVKVKRSTAGLGLFADEPISRNDFILEYTGEQISTSEADRRGGKYLFELSDSVVIDGKGRENIARYINHSCKPNCETDTVRGRIIITARKNIQTGEELTYDYGKEYFDDFIKEAGCLCSHCLSKK